MGKASALAAVTGCAAVLFAVASLHRATTTTVHAATSTWSPQAAAKFLDGRETWWREWDHANRDHGTKCVSCHTQAPMAMARPMLRGALGESEMTAGETAMLADVTKRVQAWDEMLPFYDDAAYGKGKAIESRNAESVLNAIILTNYDMPKKHLSELTRTAYDHAWALQTKTGPDAGAWVWQNFDYTPWESKESEYHWAAVLAVTIGKAPDGYRKDAKVQENLRLLAGYLKSHYEEQPLVNKVAALWAYEWFPEVMTKAQCQKLIAELTAKQRRDGGWSMADLGTWVRRDGTPIETRPDGYATGLTVLALEETHCNCSCGVIKARGLDWLASNQNPETGAWPAWSLNKNRDAENPVSLFMSDAATGYAVAALEGAKAASGR